MVSGSIAPLRRSLFTYNCTPCYVSFFPQVFTVHCLNYCVIVLLLKPLKKLLEAVVQFSVKHLPVIVIVYLMSNAWLNKHTYRLENIKECSVPSEIPDVSDIIVLGW